MPLVMRKLDERANEGRAGRHQHRISIEPGKDRSLGQQRMTGAYAEHQLFRIEMLEGKTRHFFRRSKPPHDKIEIADALLFQQHRVLASDDLDRRAGALGEEEFHRPRHDLGRDSRQSADRGRDGCLPAFACDLMASLR
jgi:hypothetical protein